uniref:Intimal thickness related receptor IRP domain-containing protein n=1 Tax=Araucaria cunninghamii TaxID=56994 RepID=A0A0D6R4H9_ARACU
MFFTMSSNPKLSKSRTCRGMAIWIFVVVVVVVGFVPRAAAEIRVSEIRSDARSIIPFDEFGFTHTGRLEMTVTHASYKAQQKIDPVHMGFFLSTRDAWIHVLQQLEGGEIHCVLDSKLIKLILTFDKLRGDHYNLTYDEVDANQYTLVFANCIPDVLVTMDVKTLMYNMEGQGASATRDYLSAGETVLPKLYYCLFLIYAVLAAVWIYVVVKNRAMAYQIHVFMAALVCLKALNLVCEAEDKSFIKRTGTAHGWDVLFYIFSFLKGIMLFTLIVLIGTGWSFLKPYLQGKEKKVLMVVIPLQVIANIATVVIDETGPYAKDWLAWKQMFLLVDVICCCAVLFPIVWSIKNLREAAHTDGKAAVNLMKLTLFRQYYVVVVGYIYFTRVVVYALATITAYQYAWTSILAGELATLGFYVFTGYKFRPIGHNPYFVIDDDEEEAAAQALKMDDDFEL